MAPREPDWDYVGSLDPESLDEEDVEKLLPVLSGWSPEGDDDRTRLMYSLAVTCIKYRNEELEEALGELQDKEELMEENKQLKAQIKKTKGGKEDKGGSVEELLEVERELQRASKELQEQAKDLEREKAEREKLESKVEDLEKDKRRLQRDMKILETDLEESRQSAAEHMASPSSDDQEVDSKRVKELEDNIRLKNKQIHQLLEDIEQLEKDNEVFQTKVSDLRDKLSEATRQINIMSSEYVSMKDSLANTKGLLDSLQEDNTSLKVKLEDQYKEKQRRDKQIEDISIQVDKKVEEMKSICDYKDAQIEELRSRLNRAVVTSDVKGTSESDRQNVAMLTKALKERDQQLEKLQEQLTDASKELESSAIIVQDLKGSKSKPGGVDPVQRSLLQVRGELFEAREKTQELTEQLAEAEESAKDKAEELSDTILKIRKYESGEYGLEDAVLEVQKLKRQVKSKNKEIENLTQQANKFQNEYAEVYEENEELREKLGLDKRADLRTPAQGQKNSTSRLEGQKQHDRALMQVMQREIERLEEERIQLKTDNRKLAQQLGQRAAKLGLDADDLQAIQEYTEALKNRRLGMSGLDGVDPTATIRMHESSLIMQKDLETQQKENNRLTEEIISQKIKYEELYEENDKLRQGMVEILDSIKEQDGKSDVSVTSPVLEKLISILDARHFYGEYKPAMGLKVRLEKLEGVNSELREQLRRARLEEEKMSSQVQRAKGKLQSAETELTALKQGNMLMPPTVAPVAVATSAVTSIPVQMSLSTSETVAKLNTQLIQVLDELDKKENLCKELEKEIEQFNKQLGVKKHQLGLLYEDYYSEKEKWEKERQEKEELVSELRQSQEGCAAKLAEYESHFKVLESGDEVIMKKVSDTTRRIAILKSNEAIITRKFKALEEKENSLRSCNSDLEKQITSLENHAIHCIGELQRQKEMSNYKIESLQKSLNESVPLSSLEIANRQYNEITAKYRDILQKQQDQSVQSRTLEELELQVQIYKEEKDTFKKELTLAKEKLCSLESIVNSIGDGESSFSEGSQGQHELNKLSKQVATLEVKELNERQKADHVSNQYKLLQSQIQQIEQRNTQLEEKLDLVTKTNLELQKTERDLRDQLVTSIPKEQFEEVSEKLRESEELLVVIKVENSKLKEVAEVAQNQVSSFENKKEVANIELEGLRHQVIDLQTQTDEMALIGRLHEQIVSLQMKDNQSMQKNKVMEGKINKLETNVLKSNRRADEMEQVAIKARSQCNIKIRSLFKVIQDLRRQYSGSIPLLKQEKLSNNLIEINMEKQKVSKLLRETEQKLKDMELKAEEMKLKQQGVDEIMTTLKHSSGTKQVLEWHSKLEDLRLKELYARRNAEKWEKEVLQLRELTQKQMRKVEKLEEDNVHLESQIEQKQLEWESREVELEKTDIVHSIREETLATDFKSIYPSPDLPLAQQLEISVANSKRYSQSLEDCKTKLSDAKKGYEELSKKNREIESQLLAKEKIINDLRAQIPASVDRAVAVTSVIGQPGVPVALTESIENKQALSIAQSTVDSLRERLKQKEETLKRYEELLNQMNVEHEQAMTKKQEEVLILQNTIRGQQTAFNELKSSKSNEILPSGATINQHIKRIQELEDEVQELQVSVGQLSSQLATSKSESDKLLHLSNSRLQEINELTEKSAVDTETLSNKQKHEVDRLIEEIRTLEQQNSVLRTEIQKLKDNQSKSPSAALKAQVERLKAEIAEKDKKQKALTRAIAELKGEMLAAAEEGNKMSAEQLKTKTNIQNLIEKETKPLQDQIVDQVQQMERFRKLLKSSKESETKLQSEVSKLKEELSKKAAVISKLREEKLDNRSSSQQRYGNSKNDREELLHQIEVLEEKLKRSNAAEKPYEDERENKIIKNAEEVARWEEKKKWQKKVEDMKQKQREADEEVSKVSKQMHGMRETVGRLEREKMLSDQKLKAALKIGGTKTSLHDEKVSQLQKENIALKEQLAAFEHNETMKQEPGTETLKLRVKFLQDRVEQQEKKISILEIGKKGGSSAVVKELEVLKKKEAQFDKVKSKLEETNIDLKVRLEALSNNFYRISEGIKNISSNVNLLKMEVQDETLIRQIEQSIDEVQELSRLVGHSRPTAGHVPKSPEKSLLTTPKEATSRRLSRNLEDLNSEAERLKEANRRLMEALEVKERRITELELMMGDINAAAAASRPGAEGDEASSPDLRLRVRQLEVDLRRKADLLSEVKVLLKQAADRERSQEAERESLKRQLKLIMDIDPKSSGEALAKELRQSKLTVERLTCQVKELEHQLSRVI